ncbi:MAG TPA: PAS domain S-box protein [Verrucomicrobiae bacterium]
MANILPNFPCLGKGIGRLTDPVMDDYRLGTRFASKSRAICNASQGLGIGTMLTSNKRGPTGASRPVLTGARAWLVAAASLVFALLLRLSFDSLWKDRLPYAGFFLIALLVVHYLEVAPAVFVIVAGFLLGSWFFVAPRHTLQIVSPVDRLDAVFYFAICFIVLFYTRRTRQALAREREAWMTVGRLAAIVESSEDAILARSLDGTITSWNSGACSLYGYTEAEAKSQPVTFLTMPENASEMMPILERVGRGEQICHLETTQRRKDGATVEVSLSVSPVRNGAGEIIGVSTIARDISEQKSAERERERLLVELQCLLGEVKTLTGLLPICSYCKKIRDDKGYWNQIEHYIGKHSRANFTHSVCPECAKHQYAQFLDERPNSL